jgi:hypothetical protein
MTFMQDLVDYAIISNADPVQVFCAGNFMGMVGNGITSQVFNMLKNVRNNFAGGFSGGPYQRSF